MLIMLNRHVEIDARNLKLLRLVCGRILGVKVIFPSKQPYQSLELET
jgi:hypothetical protein